MSAESPLPTRRPVRLLTLLSMGVLLLPGCATLFGSHQKDFNFDSTPGGAAVTVDGTPIGMTPVKVKLSNEKEHVIVFHKEGYEDATCTLQKGTGAGWVILDALGGLIPVIIDAATNSWTQTKSTGCTQPLEPTTASAS